MKKIIIPVSIAFALILIVLSCKKNPSDSESQFQSLSQQNQISTTVEQRILTFKSEIEGILKVGNDYAIDTAVRYIEGLINYTYGDITKPLMGLSLDSIYVEVVITDGKITPTEASNVYNNIIDSLTIRFEHLPSQNLHLVFTDIFSRDSTSRTVIFGVFSAFGYGSTISGGYFGSEDYWKYGNSWYGNGGYCEGSIYNGDEMYDDAAEQIERKIRVDIGFPMQRNYLFDAATLEILGDGSVFYIEENESYACVFDNEDDEDPPNYYDYYIMFQSSYYEETMHDCLCPDEMNFYLDGTEYVCMDLIYACGDVEELLDGRDFTSINIIGEEMVGWGDYWFVHHIFSTYGMWILNTTPASTF